MKDINDILEQIRMTLDGINDAAEEIRDLVDDVDYPDDEVSIVTSDYDELFNLVGLKPNFHTMSDLLVHLREKLGRS
jgi:hypothetical protein